MTTLARLALFVLAMFIAVIGYGAYSPDALLTTETTATLRNIPVSAATTVLRLGFYAAGDAPGLLYRAYGAACPLNGGNGDGGSQVKSLDGKCWLAQWPDQSMIDIRQFGAKAFQGTGVPAAGDDAAPFIQTAFASRAGRLYAPGSVGVWSIQTTISAPGLPFKLIGDYPQEIQGTMTCPTGVPMGTWFRITSSVGQFYITGGGSQGSELSNFGVCQDHPTPTSAAWQPTAYGPVIRINGTAGCLINRIYWYGIYDAIDAVNSARCTISEQRGEVFRRFWVSDHLLDMTHWHNWHIYPFWSSDIGVAPGSYVVNWQVVNGEIIRVGRMDGVQATNLFALGYNTFFHFIKSTGPDAGPSAAIDVASIYCDAIKYCVHVDSDVLGSLTASFGHMTYGGDLSPTDGQGVLVQGNGTNISIGSMYCLAAGLYCVNVTSENSFVGIGWIFARNYNTSNTAGVTALHVNSPNAALPSHIALGQYPNGSFDSVHTSPQIDNTTPNGYVSVGGVITRDYLPDLLFNGFNTGMTYASRSGHITKNIFTGEVHGNVKIVLSATGSISGNAGVTIPAGFSAGTFAQFERDTVGSPILGSNFAVAPTAPFVFAPISATGLQLLQSAGTFMTQANFANSTSIQFSW